MILVSNFLIAVPNRPASWSILVWHIFVYITFTFVNACVIQGATKKFKTAICGLNLFQKSDITLFIVDLESEFLAHSIWTLE